MLIIVLIIVNYENYLSASSESIISSVVQDFTIMPYRPLISRNWIKQRIKWYISLGPQATVNKELQHREQWKMFQDKGTVVQRFCGRNEFEVYKKEERSQCGSNVAGQGDKNDFFF